MAADGEGEITAVATSATPSAGVDPIFGPGTSSRRGGDLGPRSRPPHAASPSAAADESLLRALDRRGCDASRPLNRRGRDLVVARGHHSRGLEVLPSAAAGATASAPLDRRGRGAPHGPVPDGAARRAPPDQARRPPSPPPLFARSRRRRPPSPRARPLGTRTKARRRRRRRDAAAVGPGVRGGRTSRSSAPAAHPCTSAGRSTPSRPAPRSPAIAGESAPRCPRPSDVSPHSSRAESRRRHPPSPPPPRREGGGRSRRATAGTDLAGVEMCGSRCNATRAFFIDRFI